jgi:hypothetical protein
MLERRILQVIAVILMMLLRSGAAATKTKCIHNVTELQNALSAASSVTNTDDYVLQLRDGLYLAPSGGFIFYQFTNHSLDMEGGFFGLNGGSGCDLRILSPTGTKLDGRGNQQIFHVISNSATSGNITLRYLTFQNSGGGADALRITLASNLGTLRVTDSLFAGNSDNVSTVSLESEAGTMHFTNNAVVGNAAIQSVVDLHSGSSPSIRVYANNNTLAGNAGNGTSSPYSLSLHGSTGFDLANNIIVDSGCATAYGDPGNPAPAVNFENNDIDFFCSITPPTGSGNINQDPRFVDPDNGNYRLLPSSPAVEAGDSTPPGGTRSTDLDGQPRVVGTIDMGAYEVSNFIFANGFEL